MSLPSEMRGTCERGRRETLGVSRIEDYRRTWPSELTTQISYALTNTEVANIWLACVCIRSTRSSEYMLQPLPVLGTLILTGLLYPSSFDMKNSAVTQYIETLT